MSRIVCHFSCGAPSAVATKLTLADYPTENVFIINAFLQQEHEDNRRFAGDCEAWFGKSITILRDEKYGASTYEVWRRKQYIKGPNGAPCSNELKRKVLNAWSQETDIWVIGYTAEEQDRADSIRELYPVRTFNFPLIDRNLSKPDCLAIVERAGIVLPVMYQLGFDNPNCIGCPKGGQNYWQKIRKHFPLEFHEIVQIQQAIGPGAHFLQHRSGPKKGERMSLLELPDGDGNMADEPSFSCSFFCQMAEQDIAK